jgi:hypothetical protein
MAFFNHVFSFFDLSQKIKTTIDLFSRRKICVSFVVFHHYSWLVNGFSAQCLVERLASDHHLIRVDDPDKRYESVCFSSF